MDFEVEVAVVAVCVVALDPEAIVSLLLRRWSCSRCLDTRWLLFLKCQDCLTGAALASCMKYAGDGGRNYQYREKCAMLTARLSVRRGFPAKFSINQFLSSEQGSPLSTYHVCSIGAKRVSLFNVHTLEFPQFHAAQDLTLVT